MIIFSMVVRFFFHPAGSKPIDNYDLAIVTPYDFGYLPVSHAPIEICITKLVQNKFYLVSKS